MGQLWEKLLFWKKSKVLEEGKDFAFIEFEGAEMTGVQLLTGKYEDVVYHYEKARIKEEGELARLQFGYTIVHSGKHNIDLLQNDEEFVTIMGDILTQILLNRAKADEQIRTNNSEEFDIQ
jgi:hypothetical protein